MFLEEIWTSRLFIMTRTIIIHWSLDFAKNTYFLPLEHCVVCTMFAPSINVCSLIKLALKYMVIVSPMCVQRDVAMHGNVQNSYKVTIFYMVLKALKLVHRILLWKVCKSTRPQGIECLKNIIPLLKSVLY